MQDIVGVSHASTLECLYDCLLDIIFLFYQNKLILTPIHSALQNVEIVRICEMLLIILTSYFTCNLDVRGEDNAQNDLETLE